MTATPQPGAVATYPILEQAREQVLAQGRGLDEVQLLAILSLIHI